MDAAESVTAALLKRWHLGDRESLEALLERHLPWIKQHVRRRLGSGLRRKTESGDIVQDAVIQFLDYCPRIQVSDESLFRALMVRIVENVLRDKNDWFRAQRRAIARERPLPSDTILVLDPPAGGVRSPSRAADRNEQEAWIRLGIELLGEKDREVIVRHDWGGESFVTIGRDLGSTPDAARMRYNRAVERLGATVGALRRGGLAEALESRPGAQGVEDGRSSGPA